MYSPLLKAFINLQGPSPVVSTQWGPPSIHGSYNMPTPYISGLPGLVQTLHPIFTVVLWILQTPSPRTCKSQIPPGTITLSAWRTSGVDFFSPKPSSPPAVFIGSWALSTTAVRPTGVWNQWCRGMVGRELLLPSVCQLGTPQNYMQMLPTWAAAGRDLAFLFPQHKAAVSSADTRFQNSSLQGQLHHVSGSFIPFNQRPSSY